MRSLVWTGSVALMVISSGVVAGQQPGRPAAAVVATVLTERTRIPLTLDPAAVLDRILSFDANADNRISRDELPERMEGLVSRGDRNQDGFLTANEIAPLVDIPVSEPQRPFSVIRREPGRLADIIADLKLPPALHSRALEIVNRPKRADHFVDLDFRSEMKELLDAEDYDNYIAAADRLRRTPRINAGVGFGVGVGVIGVASDPAPARR